MAAVRRRVRGRRCGACAFVVLVCCALVVLALVILVLGQMRVAPRRADERRELLHGLRYDELGTRVWDGGVSRRRVVQRGVRRLRIGMVRRRARAGARVGPVVCGAIRCTGL